MEVDAFMALMRLTHDDDRVVANLAHMALNLAKGIREAEARAELAEVALEAERSKIATFMANVQKQYSVGQARAAYADVWREMAA